MRRARVRKSSRDSLVRATYHLAVATGRLKPMAALADIGSSVSGTMLDRVESWLKCESANAHSTPAKRLDEGAALARGAERRRPTAFSDWSTCDAEASL